MAKNSIRDYDATSGNNTDVQSVDISEGCAASGINNALREIMADLKDVSTGTVNLETPAADRLDVDNIRIDGNTISSTDTNGDITLDPNGTGDTIMTGSGGQVTIDENGHITSKQSLDAATAGGRIIGASNRGTVGQIDIAQTTSSADGGHMRFMTCASGSTNPTEHMRIDSYGRTLINATSANTGSKLVVAGTNTRTSSGSCADEGMVLMPVANLTTGDYTPWLAFTPRDSSSTPSRARAAIGAVSTSAVAALDMVFATRSAADGSEMTGADEKMRLTSGGNLFINTTNTSPNPGISLAPSGGVTLGNNNGTSGFYFLYMTRNTSLIGSITQSGTTGVAFNTSSDYRLKENVADMTGAITRVKALAPKRFNWVAEDDDRTVDGFLAHEAQAVVPEAVTGTHNEVETWTQQQIDDGDAPDGTSAGDNKLDEDGNTIPVMQGIDQSKLVPLLTGALQEAIAKIETLETEMTALKARLTALEA